MKKTGFMVLAATIAVSVAAEAQLCAEEASLPGPRYLNLRYDEDFSYLAGPEDSYRQDLWDPIKWIGLSDAWHLTVGGQARLRLESETNKSFGSGTPSHDAFLVQRYFVHTDLRQATGLRFFVQGKFAYVTDRDRRVGLAGLEDHADLHQGFADIPTSLSGRPITFRLGRQELQYGAQRLISPLDWGNTRRTFDGMKFFTDLAGWRVDAFAVRPVVGDRRNLDDENENLDFYGVYATKKASEALSKDVYFLLLKNNDESPNANFRLGRRTLYTTGTRLWGKRGDWDYETELAGQFGTLAGDRVRAWMAAAGGGYTFADVAWTPRVGVLYDYASGDRDPNDGTHSTFNQHFPLGHAWLGYLDLVGRSNIHAIKAQLKVKPTDKITAWADFHTFLADQDRDALYSAGGIATRRDRDGAGSHAFGHELDLTMKIALDAHTSAMIGYAHMWPGGFVSATGDDDEPDLIYAMIEYKF
ncbi:MAG: alginate export family protein [Planctomycetota bacterium]